MELDCTEVEPETILDRRLVKKGNAAYLQVLIQWTSLPSTMATWEDYEVLHKRFPDAPAWGQAGTQGGGSVTAIPVIPGDKLSDEEAQVQVLTEEKKKHGELATE